MHLSAPECPGVKFGVAEVENTSTEYTCKMLQYFGVELRRRVEWAWRMVGLLGAAGEPRKTEVRVPPASLEVQRGVRQGRCQSARRARVLRTARREEAWPSVPGAAEFEIKSARKATGHQQGCRRHLPSVHPGG